MHAVRASQCYSMGTKRKAGMCVVRSPWTTNRHDSCQTRVIEWIAWEPQGLLPVRWPSQSSEVVKKLHWPRCRSLNDLKRTHTAIRAQSSLQPCFRGSGFLVVIPEMNEAENPFHEANHGHGGWFRRLDKVVSFSLANDLDDWWSIYDMKDEMRDVKALVRLVFSANQMYNKRCWLFWASILLRPSVTFPWNFLLRK